MPKYLVFYVEGDISGPGEEHKFLEAENGKDAVSLIVKLCQERVDSMGKGLNPWFEIGKVYEIKEIEV